VDLTYDDREAGHLLGVWIVALCGLLLSTTRLGYSPVVGNVADSAVFIGLLVLVGLGAVYSRYRDLGVGVPMAVCGSLVVWVVGQSLFFGPASFDARTVCTALGLAGLGGLFVREGVLIARGRRHRSCRRQPPTRWRWWLGAGVVVAVGISGL